MKRKKIPTKIFNTKFWEIDKNKEKYKDIIIFDNDGRHWKIKIDIQTKGLEKPSIWLNFEDDEYFDNHRSFDPHKYPWVSIPKKIFDDCNFSELDFQIWNQEQKEKDLIEEKETLIAKRVYRELLFNEELTVNTDNFKDNDWALIENWNNGEKLTPWDRGRLISARKAEIASIEYLKNYYTKVDDESINQIDDSKSDWKLFDIKTESGLYFDVKNSRHFQANRNVYTEHTIPKFKESRDGKNIDIISVLSDYVRLNEENEFKETNHLILGIVNLETLRSLTAYINNKFKNILNINSLSNGQHQLFPGWVFDYPNEYYKKDELDELPIEFPENFDKTKLSTWCSIYLYEIGFLDIKHKFDEEENIIIQDILELKNNNNLTRPFVFYYVIGVLLKNISNKDAYNKISTFIKNLLFKNQTKKFFTKRPLGVYDPLEYIKNIIDIFDQYRSNIASENFDAYKLSHPMILRGIKNEKESTIIAYCGGKVQRREGASVPCGAYPMVFGKNKRCHTCGYLICNDLDCQFCSISCRNKNRFNHFN